MTILNGTRHGVPALAALVTFLLFFPGGLAAAPVGGSTATGTSNKMNPALSLNGLFLAGWSDPAGSADGIKAQEFELVASSIVDPYFKAFANVAFDPDPAGGEAGVAVEEGYVRVLGMPEGFGLRGGRFYLPMGRHNQLHSHQFPLINAPRAVQRTLGDESVGDVGVELEYAPLLPWYVNVRLTGTDGANGLFDGESRDMAAGARLENLWDVGESATFEVAGSVLNGPIPDGDRRTLYGADARLKWHDPRKTYGKVVTWTNELLVDHVPGRKDVSGAYSILQVRFARLWWAGAGYSWDSLVPDGLARRTSENEARLQLAWVPSEFSAVRGEIGWTDPAEGDRELTAQLQLNFTIGAHPAHKY